ncbi:hypothetical protein [uncultured Thermanaerothrix sp.]|uniref:hypothetical protein n=1 Tax=uncultured Thermanaerothrix sp. TaxID=1195149 RepID=UPI0026146AB6|nr:hypothetical protein [uncultured Thermanaerothrix sp.]
MKTCPKIWRLLLFMLIVYLVLGLAFHVGWETAQAQCRQVQASRGEFVEPGVFAWPLRLAFDLTFWPVYTWANLYHDGVIFATPCTH